MNTTNFPTMNTITQAAATSGLAVYRIRQLCQSGRIKSIRCGRRTLVNMDSLAAYLNDGDAVQPAPAVGSIRRVDES
ncbi:helix-turn-helix domain-containing protein [Gemmiger sp.]|uniref:helix-turn-helix domain-containing protein n=1 Tax=Gemmiger sp. TaxID=2049027 RepID=UPI002F946FBA